MMIVCAVLPLLLLFQGGFVVASSGGNETSAAATTHAPSYVFFLGPPAAGKGTQSSILVQKYHLCHISAGDLLRAEVKAGTAFGLKVKEIMRSGGLVHDPYISELVAREMAKPECLQNGFIVDGSPRRVEQIDELRDAMHKLNISLTAVVAFDADDDLLVRRSLGRLVHTPSGRIYHEVFNPPKVPGRDDVTGEALTRRTDDTAATVRTRLEEYRKKTLPVLDYYERTGQLRRVNGAEEIDVVTAHLEQLLHLRAPADLGGGGGGGSLTESLPAVVAQSQS